MVACIFDDEIQFVLHLLLRVQKLVLSSVKQCNGTRAQNENIYLLVRIDMIIIFFIFKYSLTLRIPQNVSFFIFVF